ncbi:MAG TPA: hypothetical protein VNI60_12690 [Pyrinomonadaceae bacterium]|nr:hypothetical protein [Pyrinomonadaceae bacterium]
MKRNEKIWLIIFGLISVVYILLRMWNLTASCLWFDEIFSVHAATHSWQSLYWFVAQDMIHPPLFYVLLKIWIFVGGENLSWLRFFPVLFSILSIIPFLLLCRQLKLPSPSIALALTFFAVNGSLIKYAQEVRMYSLLLCFALFSMWVFVRFLNTGKGFLFLLIINILLVYTHYFGWLIIASEVFAVVILARERLKQILLMSFLSFLSFTPWIFAIWQATKINANVGQNIGWMTKPNLPAIFQFVFDLFEPIYFEQSNTDEPTIFFITLPILLVGIIAFGLYFTAWKSETKIEKRKFSLLLIFTFAPILMAFIASWILPYSIWGTRHLIIAFAPFAILLAIAFTKIFTERRHTNDNLNRQVTGVPVLKGAVLLLVFLLFAAAFLLQATRSKPKYIWCAWENLALSLPQTQSDSQITNSSDPIKIYVFEDLVAYHFWFALRDSSEKFQIIKVNGIEGLTEDKAYFLPRDFDKIKSPEDFEGERFFVAFRAQNWNESAPPLQNLISKGYRIGEPQFFEAQGLKAFLVEVGK